MVLERLLTQLQRQTDSSQWHLSRDQPIPVVYHLPRRTKRGKCSRQSSSSSHRAALHDKTPPKPLKQMSTLSHTKCLHFSFLSQRKVKTSFLQRLRLTDMCFTSRAILCGHVPQLILLLTARLIRRDFRNKLSHFTRSQVMTERTVLTSHRHSELIQAQKVLAFNLVVLGLSFGAFSETTN